VQTLGQVFLLPLPVDVVDLGVVEVEERFYGRVVLEGALEITDFNVLGDLPPGLFAALPA
jgi:metal-sulfur cluster biosynthetic enzyme